MMATLLVAAVGELPHMGSGGQVQRVEMAEWIFWKPSLGSREVGSGLVGGRGKGGTKKVGWPCW